MNNPNACIYFYHKGLIKYEGVMLKGKMEVLTDQETKDMIWRKGDTMVRDRTDQSNARTWQHIPVDQGERVEEKNKHSKTECLFNGSM